MLREHRKPWGCRDHRRHDRTGSQRHEGDGKSAADQSSQDRDRRHGAQQLSPASDERDDMQSGFLEEEEAEAGPRPNPKLRLDAVEVLHHRYLNTAFEQ